MLISLAICQFSWQLLEALTQRYNQEGKTRGKGDPKKDPKKELRKEPKKEQPSSSAITPYEGNKVRLMINIKYTPNILQKK